MSVDRSRVDPRCAGYVSTFRCVTCRMERLPLEEQAEFLYEAHRVAVMHTQGEMPQCRKHTLPYAFEVYADSLYS